METTRQRILEQLTSKHSASATELSQSLRMTAANVRHHLAVLLDEGVVEVAGERPGGGRGRPTQLYTLTKQAHLHNLNVLASALLQELLAGLEPQERLAALARIASRLGPECTGGSNLTQRLNACIHSLNAMNYQARWEAHSQGPHLIFAHCPYATILPEHPELCQMDASLLEGTLDASVVQTARLAPSRQGGMVCIFNIRPGNVRRLSVNS